MTLRDQLKRDEGFRVFPYTDTEGFLTIGYGRNLTTKGIDRDEAEYLLDRDIAKAKMETNEALPWVAEMDEARQAVIYNLCFNVGLGGLLGFRKMLAAAKLGDYETAAWEMKDSKWYTQVGPRAARLATQMRDGIWM